MSCAITTIVAFILASVPLYAATRPPLKGGPDTGLVVQAAANAGLQPLVLRLALRAYARAERAGLTTQPLLTVIDYSMRSRRRRLWVLDLATGQVLAHELVAHGSGNDNARWFSNRPGSRQSSLGTFITGQTYQGRHGLSLQLRGIDPGVNDAAETRAIVMHGADYVSTAVIDKLGRLGRSQGCPALSPTAAKRVIGLIRGGTVLFAYAPSPTLNRILAQQ